MRIYGIFDTKKSKVVYVGKTKNIKDFAPHGKHIKKIVAGDPLRYDYQILEENIEDLLLLNEREKYFIQHHNTFHDKECFNFTEGGDGGYCISKLSKEEREVIKAKELKTKRDNPSIMKDTAARAYKTFLNRPEKERKQIVQSRWLKSKEAKDLKTAQLTDEQRQQRRDQHSNDIKNMHSQRSEERKREIHQKISATLTKSSYTLQNKETGEIKTLSFTQWKRSAGVDLYVLNKRLQKTSHGWQLLTA